MKNKNKQQLSSIGILFLTNIILTWVLVKTPAWKLIESMSRGLEWIIGQSQEGIKFVFGDLSQQGIFLLSALMPIVFISAFIGILTHLNIIPIFVRYFGKLFSKLFKVNHIVGVNAVTNMFLGQTESLFVTKTSLSKVNDNVIFATLVGGMSSVSVSITGLYIGFGVSAEYIVISMILTSVSSLLFCQIFAPTYESEEIVIETDKKTNIFDTMFHYGYEGFKSAIAIAVALMMFISFLNMIDNVIPLTNLLSYIFYPITFLMGIPIAEIPETSLLLATRLLTNEAVAFGLPSFNNLTESTKAVMTIALCGFSGIGSIGILLGGFSVVAPDKLKVVAKLGFKALLVSTLSTCFSGALLNLFI